VSLSGRANGDTMSLTGIPIGLPPAVGLRYHQAGYIWLVVEAGGVLPRPLPTPSGPPYTKVSASIHGHPATMLYPADHGPGGYHIQWVQNGDFVSVQTNRGRTTDGLSGVPLSQLERVAEGLQLG
jgi:hypothetical protein